ncbi:hypothetical protein [Actinoplanes sp. NPDC051494]|uniref:hypothetical protein n=1 Tax=Actinoplanes sp. NPDC051494 TaxID=3363907 RepID=UPI0037A6340E
MTTVRWTVGRMLAAGFLLALAALAVVGTSAYVRIGTLLQDRAPIGDAHRALGEAGKVKDALGTAEHSPPGSPAYTDAGREVAGSLHRLAEQDGGPRVAELRALAVTVFPVPPGEATDPRQLSTMQTLANELCARSSNCCSSGRPPAPAAPRTPAGSSSASRSARSSWSRSPPG